MFVFTADNHINLRGLRPEIPMEDTLQPLADTVAFCILNKCPLVLGGDLYDTNNPPARLVARVNEILARMALKGLEVWAIQGNHDKDPETPWSTIAPGVQWLHGKTVKIGGLLVHGIDFAPASISGPRISAIPECDVVVIHQALRQGLGFDDAWNCDLDWFDSSKVKNVLAGDLHKVLKGIWSTDKKVQGLYSGTPYMTTLDESPHPSFLVVEGLGTSGHLVCRREPLAHRPFWDITASTEQELLDALPGDPQALPVPIVVLRYPIDAQEVLLTAKKVLKGAFVIEKPLPARAGFSTSRNMLVVEAREGITLGRLINEKVEDPALKGFLQELVGSRDREGIQGVLAAHRAAALQRT